MPYNTTITHRSMNTSLANSTIDETRRAHSDSQDVISRVEARKSTVLAALIPDPQLRAKAKGELALVETEYEYRVAALKIVRESSLQSLTAVHDTFIKQGKIGLHDETSKFMMHRFHEFEQWAQSELDDFVNTVLGHYQTAEAIQVSRVREMRIAQIDEGLSAINDLKALLTRQFLDIVETTVRVS